MQQSAFFEIKRKKNYWPHEVAASNVQLHKANFLFPKTTPMTVLNAHTLLGKTN